MTSDLDHSIQMTAISHASTLQRIRFHNDLFVACLIQIRLCYKDPTASFRRNIRIICEKKVLDFLTILTSDKFFLDFMIGSFPESFLILAYILYIDNHNEIVLFILIIQFLGDPLECGTDDFPIRLFTSS